MKKTALVVAAVFISVVTFAQDLTSKKGEVILPESGDIALGFDATPFLNYAGNLFNSANNAPRGVFIDSSLAIYGKYFADAQTAYRARVRIGFSSAKNTEPIIDDVGVATDPEALTEDEMKVSGNDIVIGFGIEKRKGNTRLQGYYGGEILIMLGGSKTTYSYGNDFSSANPVPTSTDFNGNVLPGGGRVTTNKAGSTMGVGLRGFIGAEYFIFPKISCAVEYGWGLGYYSVGAAELTVETLNTTGSAGEETTVEGGKYSFLGIDTDNNGGSLKILFHF